MKVKLFTKVLVVVLALLMVLSVPAAASSAYQTYTYSISGSALYSPDAYNAARAVTSSDMGLDVDMKNPSDIATDDLQNVYIADAGNNRVVVLDRYLKYKFSISTFINAQGNDDALSNPQGVYVTKDRIWVCDTGWNRIAVFDRAGKFIKVLDAPKSNLFDENAVYKPVAVAVDQNNRVYVVSSTTYQGIIVLNEDGEFNAFIGAQAVTISAWEIIWRRFQTDEQKKLQASKVSTEFNNIDMTPDGFIYVTTSSIEEGTVMGAIYGKSKNGDNLPVKLLNSKGDEIMRRNGFWPPAGEVDFSRSSKDSISGVSRIIDVAVGPEQTWSVIDEKRGKIYTYDYDGNLLFAFGDTGSMLGSISNIEAITYQDTNIMVLDKGNNCIVVFERTEYGDLLIEAITAQNSLDYDYAIDCWREVLQRNSNFDAAYVGIGQALYRSGEYKVPPGSYIYTCFTSDFFLPDADAWRDEAWAMIKERSDCVFMFYTKRIDRLERCVPGDWGDGYENVIIGCTVENQAMADYRLPVFINAPVKHRTVGIEPMLERVDISRYLNGEIASVSVGGESGANARPCDFDWVIDVRKQCVEKGVSFSYHQTGSRLIKDGKMFLIPRRLQHSQAKKAGIDYRK